MQWLLSLKLVVLLTVANGIPAVAWRVFGEYFNRPLDGGVAFFDRQPIFGHSKRSAASYCHLWRRRPPRLYSGLIG